MKKYCIIFMVFFTFTLCCDQKSTIKIHINKLPVIIQLTDDGGFSYKGGSVSREIKRGEYVVWLCEYPFSLFFSSNSPYLETSNNVEDQKKPRPWGYTLRGIQSTMIEVKSGKGQKHQVKVYVSDNALNGSYKYIVAVYKNGKIWIDDPEDIIKGPRREN